MKKVVIIGAGPAGLFAANELAGGFNVTIIEKTSYVGGSGLVSDGKLNFHPSIGGALNEFLPEEGAWKLVSEIREIFNGLEELPEKHDELGLRDLEARAAKAGMKFIKIRQSHIGSDHLNEIMAKMRRRLEDQGVKITLERKVTDLKIEQMKAVAVKADGENIPADFVLLAPGRSGSSWLIKTMKEHGIKMQYNPIDIGFRVEVPNSVMDEVVQDYGCWDPKFHIYAKSYDDFVRTFCVCPRGFVVREAYDDDLFGVNGHSMRETESPNTNFALLVRISLTSPLENTTEYGRRIAQLANTLGGRRPLIQRLGDLKGNRRSTWDRIKRSYVEPTLKEVTPGDVSMAYPHRIVKDLLEGLEMLDKVMPGTDSDSTLIYAPEIKFYAMRIQTDPYLQTAIPNLFVAGDGAGVSRGIVGAAATGIIAARGIQKTL